MLAGCAGMRQAYWSGGARWGCEAESLQSASAAAHRGVDGLFVYTPAVGWGACDLIARTGMPSSVTTVANAFGESQHLYYNANIRRGGGLVILERTKDGAGWIVESVVWDDR